MQQLFIGHSLPVRGHDGSWASGDEPDRMRISLFAEVAVEGVEETGED